MSVEDYNELLNKIKLFHTYLGNILAAGYMNEYEDLKILTDKIDNIN